MLLLCSSYVTDVIKNLELLLLVVMISFKIKFGHTTINLPKISMLMLKTACINPYFSSIQVYSSNNHLWEAYLHLTGTTPLCPQNNIDSIHWLVCQYSLILLLISCQIFEYLTEMNQKYINQDVGQDGTLQYDIFKCLKKAS